ncbi:MAG: hypothetical protein ACK5HP_04615 [Bacilli bacterium]
MENDEIYKLIKSTTIKEYCIKNNHIFSLLEKAIIINPSTLYFENKLNELEKLVLVNEKNDEQININEKTYTSKEIIQNHIHYNRKIEIELKENDGMRIYELSAIQDYKKYKNYNKYGIYKTFNDAMNAFNKINFFEKANVLGTIEKVYFKGNNNHY